MQCRHESARWILPIVFSLALSGCLHSSESEPVDPVLVDRLRIEAMMSADPDGLDLVLHDDLSYVHSNGQIDTKTVLVQKLVTGQVSYLSVAPENPRGRVHGDFAIVTAPVSIEVVAGGQNYRVKSIYTAVYGLEDGRWQLVAYQSSPLPTP